MLGWKLFLRALSLLIDNLVQALRLTLLPYAGVIATTVWIATSWPELAGQMQFDPENPAPPSYAGAIVLQFMVMVVASIWMAVAWHRYVLESEGGEGWVPPFHGGLLLGYLGRSILVGLAVAALVLAVSTMVSLLLLPLFGVGITPLIGTLALFVAMILFYRLGVVLPAGAVGRTMTFADAWRATKGHSGTVIVLALVTVAFSFVLQLPAQIDGGGIGIVSVTYQVVVQWIGLMLGIGTLTALYGHLVEGRPVD